MVRAFQESDRKACQQIAAAAALSSYGAQMPELRPAFSGSAELEPADVRLVATISETPVGFLELVGAHISNVFVDPRHQGKGVGRALMTSAERTAPGDLTLSVFTINPRARRFYERLGYCVEAASQILFHGIETDVWRMRKVRSVDASRRRFDLVILDFDGVLADSASWMLRNLDGVCERHGLRRPDPATIDRLRALSNRQILGELRAPFWKLPAIARDMRARMAADASEISLFPGVPAFLGRLREAGVVAAIVSSNSEGTVRTILGPANAERIARFDCGASLFGKAPVFKRVQRSLATPQDRVLCVGDESRDVDAARAAGFCSAAVTWGYAAPEALNDAAPDHIVGDFEALLEVIGA